VHLAGDGAILDLESERETHVSKKPLGKTVLGWFVVQDEDEEEAPEASPEEVVQKYVKKPPPPLPPETAPPSIRLQGDVPQMAAGNAPDARVYAKVFQAAGIKEDEQERVEKTLNLLRSLPTETPKDVRKQIVEASLKAFGVPVEAIIETAAEELQALEAFIQHGERHTQNVLAEANAQVEKLALQITEVKKLMELQVRTQQGVVRSTNEQKLRVQSVLEFFGQDAVARVVQESPKLVELK
jgi:hypothetical protein